MQTSDTMTELGSLPNEMLLAIAGFLDNQRDLSAFARSDRRLYALLHADLCRFNIKHHKGSALIHASSKGHIDLVKKLLDLGASIATFEPTLEERIFTRKLRLSCSRGFMLGDCGMSIGNPLTEAARHGTIEILKILLNERRKSLGCSEHQVRRLFSWAIEKNNIEVLDLAFARGGLPRDILDEAVDDDECHLGTLERLLQHGADFSPPESDDKMHDPWYHLAMSKLQGTGQKDAAVIRLLFRYGRRPRSDRVLCELAKQNNLEGIRRLTEIPNGLDLSMYGHTALFLAIQHGSLRLVKYLIANGANPHLSCAYELLSQNHSTISIAIQSCQLSILAYLVGEQRVFLEKKDVQMANVIGQGKTVRILGERLAGVDSSARVKVSDYVARMEREKGKPDAQFHALETVPLEVSGRHLRDWHGSRIGH